ncbi:poly(3-hydroxybutyrate) depolymerase [Polaromonas sp. CG_9.5]|uniref:polyhydroxyalkanoate depolymerase n=1 Tax=Polaromonas sp. CG_9.5 TaxID=3071705 RepID=UPI002E00487D|nr:poly(3-hydroxybutyrate) depolymerase [Polaromonas sp. CG_9.5]
MLYQLYESQRTLMEPFVDFAQAAAKLYGGSSSPIGKTPLAQRVSAGYSLMYRLGKGYEKPSFDIHTVDADGVALAIQERIELDKPFCELRRFKRFSDDTATLARLKNQPAVLVVAPLSGHYATLLRDTVKTMLKDHKVYITDWKNARNVPLSDGTFNLDDYVNYVQEFIRHLQGKYGNCHVISVCQPTVPVFAAISLMASRGETTPLSMIMMGGPIDARQSATAVNDLATTKPYEWFEKNVIYPVPGNFPGKGRRVYPGFLQHTGFVAMNPDRHATSHYDYFKNLIKGDDASTDAHRKFYDEYNAVLDMDADYYLDTIKTVFQEFKLVKGTWEVMSVDGKLERVMPSDIKTTAVMTVEGELDDISGAGQTRAALAMCSGVPESHKTHLEAKGAGHYGIFSGRRWRDVVYPAVKAFILEENKSLMPAETLPVAAKKAAPVAKAAKAPKAAKKPTPVTTEAATPEARPAPKSEAKPAVKPVAKRASKPVLVAVKQAKAPAAAAPVATPEKAAPAVVASSVAAVPAKAATTAETAATPLPPEQSAA